MKLYISPKSSARAFTRPQWLFIILLGAVAFEIGARFGQKQPEQPAKPAAKKLQVSMPHQPLLEAELKPTEGEPAANLVETNLAGETNLNEQTVAKAPVKATPQSRTQAAPATSGPRVISDPSSPQRHKVAVQKPRYPIATNLPLSGVAPPGGVRVAIP